MNTKTVYIPYMSDHCYILEAAFASQGVAAEVLPQPDDEAIDIGLDVLIGKECAPCFITTGDIIRRANQPDFEAQQSIMLMPGSNGPCRFGQYAVLQRDIMDQHGLQEVELVSSSAANAYQGFGENPTKLRKLVWEGAVIVDMLQKLLHAYRPYEINAGQTDVLYEEGLRRVLEATRQGGGKSMSEVVQWLVREFEALPVDRTERRPLIGVVGEIYLRLNPYANQDIIRQVEALGGEVMLASMLEWLYFTNWDYVQLTKALGQYFDLFVTTLTDLYQRYREYRLIKPAAHLLDHPYETPIGQLMDYIRPYFDPALNTEAVLSMGKAIDLAHHGACGLLNIMPFSCMPGIITASIAPRMRADLNDVPWLDVVFDAQGGTNFNTRLEAFMYQATQFHRRAAMDRSPERF